MVNRSIFLSTQARFDPPSGWAYGFPRQLPVECVDDEIELRWWLVECGYPYEMLDLAVKHGRVLEVETGL